MIWVESFEAFEKRFEAERARVLEGNARAFDWSARPGGIAEFTILEWNGRSETYRAMLPEESNNAVHSDQRNPD